MLVNSPICYTDFFCLMSSVLFSRCTVTYTLNWNLNPSIVCIRHLSAEQTNALSLFASHFTLVICKLLVLTDWIEQLCESSKS